MYNYLEALLLNMLFLVVFLLFIPHIIETNLKNLSSKQKEQIKLGSTIVAMISCMSFPFQIGDEIFMDLRTVAIMVGGFYLGRKATVILVVIFLIYRSYLGGLGSGVLAAVTAGTILLIALFLLHDIFNKATKRKKVFIACSFSLFLCIILLVVRAILFEHLICSDYMAMIAFLSIHLLSTFFIVYFYEVMRETVYLNKQVIKAEKLEIVSHLASSISHEVRNPLTVVKGFLQMLTKDKLDEEKRDMYIELSLNEIDRANDIIVNYLTFAKPAQPEYVIIDLQRELNRSIDMIRPMANMHCVEIDANIEPSYIKGDTQLLQQCFLNITKNCIEAMPNGGNLLINTKEIDGDIMIEITDTGEGMTKEQLHRLGEPFFTTKGREGTGLGMMAVLKIIENMNGKLDVKSNVKEGTKFSIYFPQSQTP
ncbi:MAG: ATP-binding protein [Anaerobacillus sp.]|uniref:ATP-binding protein n=1 Tax=Anaerobacillus sp. TaxID=1872506 RepID=UPI00391A3C6C